MPFYASPLHEYCERLTSSRREASEERGGQLLRSFVSSGSVLERDQPCRAPTHFCTGPERAVPRREAGGRFGPDSHSRKLGSILVEVNAPVTHVEVVVR